jgi:hypothetical protein
MPNIIFTKHALQRLDERSFSQSHVEAAIRNPDSVIAGREKGTLEYQKKCENSRVTAIVGKGTKGEDVVLSCWIDPPIYGTKDYQKKERYRRYQKAGFWEKVAMDVLSAFGL